MVAPRIGGAPEESRRADMEIVPHDAPILRTVSRCRHGEIHQPFAEIA
jgi:hypothetical protein